MSEAQKYSLDRTAFKSMTLADADAEMQSSKELTATERFDQFNYLMSIAFRFYGEEWPKMEKNVFESRKRE